MYMYMCTYYIYKYTYNYSQCLFCGLFERHLKNCINYAVDHSSTRIIFSLPESIICSVQLRVS